MVVGVNGLAGGETSPNGSWWRDLAEGDRSAPTQTHLMMMWQLLNDGYAHKWKQAPGKLAVALLSVVHMF